MNHTIENALRLARRTLDKDAAVIYGYYNDSLARHDRPWADQYARQFNALVMLRAKLTPQGIAAASGFTGPEAVDLIPL